MTSHGTSGASRSRRRTTDEVVRRLREAGAIVIAGRRTCPSWRSTGSPSRRRGASTRNPWNTGRHAGRLERRRSGAAVAAGLVGGASASDGAGSIRIPAADCGLFGLKPQRGRLPFTPAEALVRDVGQRLPHPPRDRHGAVPGRDGAGRRPGSPRRPEQRPFVEAANRSPGELRIAWSLKPPRLIAPPIVEEPVRGAVEKTAELLSSLGHTLSRSNPHYGSVGNGVTPRYLCGIQQDVEAIADPSCLEDRTRALARLGARIPRRSLRKAVEGEAKLATKINAIFDDCDVLLTPTVGRPPVEVGKWDGTGALLTVIGMSRTYPFTGAWNYTGQPAAAVPAGFTEDGLPLSVQLVGRPGDEATLISLAAQLEADRGWPERRPQAS